MAQKIMVVDDEQEIREMLCAVLKRHGYQALAAADAQQALGLLERQPDLILLDVQMPGVDGIALCKTIRVHVGCPILFVTARVEEADKLAGFAAGGDDYILKPFSIAELLARVEAHLRREERHQGVGKVKFAGDVVVDSAQRTVTAGGQGIPLARREFDIVELLCLHPGQVFDKERIYELIWGYDGEGTSAVVTELIRRIRQKLQAVGCEGRIETVWGVGYKWKP